MFPCAITFPFISTEFPFSKSRMLFSFISHLHVTAQPLSETNIHLENRGNQDSSWIQPWCMWNSPLFSYCTCYCCRGKNIFQSGQFFWLTFLKTLVCEDLLTDIPTLCCFWSCIRLVRLERLNLHFPTQWLSSGLFILVLSPLGNKTFVYSLSKFGNFQMCFFFFFLKCHLSYLFIFKILI